jgi:DNA-binding NarL/FixJ family response regulator
MSHDVRPIQLRSCCCDAEHLTEREVTVLALAADGYTNAQIADSLAVSRHTVARHMTAMLRRAQERNRAGLITRAYAAGILIAGERPPRLSGRRCLPA